MKLLEDYRMAKRLDETDEEFAQRIENPTEQKPIYMRSKKQTWETPKDLFEKLDSLYHFECDCAASAENALCEEFLSAEKSFLEHVPWGDMCFLNPPYGRGKISTGPFLKRAQELSISDNKTFVCLVAARTGTKWFQTCWGANYIVFIRGQLKFGGQKENAPFCSVLVVFNDVLTQEKFSTLSKIGKVIKL